MTGPPAPAAPAARSAMSATTVDSPGTVSFVLTDPDPDRLRGVRLWQEVRLAGDALDFHRADGAWRLEIPRPAVDRMEYLFELTHADGGRQTVLDPANPRRVGGAFGDHSVLEFPQYRRPGWLDLDPGPPGTRRAVRWPTTGVGPGITGILWSPPGVPDDEPAGLLVVHDGPEYDELAALTTYLRAGLTAGTLPPLRAALLSPGPRSEWYSANAAYSRALTTAVLPRLREQVAVRATVGMGTSLGALAMLVAHRLAPGAFDALFLQSGSFFQRGVDDQERGFVGFGRITRAVAGMLASAGSRHPVPTVLTCGTIEENLANNRAMRRALAAQGYPATLHEVRDVHNYTAWRDAFDPHLTGLLQQVGR